MLHELTSDWLKTKNVIKDVRKIKKTRRDVERTLRDIERWKWERNSYLK